jgi:hypothetical protein
MRRRSVSGSISAAVDQHALGLGTALARLTLRHDKHAVQLEGEQRIRQLAQELLEQRGQLHGVVVRQVHRRAVAVQRLGTRGEAADVAVLAEDALDRHVHLAHRRDDVVHKRRHAQLCRSRAQRRVCAVALDEHVERDAKDACGRSVSLACHSHADAARAHPSS